MLIFYAYKRRYCGNEKSDGMCSVTDVDEFSGFFLHPSIFSMVHSRSV